MTIFRFKYLFLAGLILQEIIRFPHRKRHRDAWRGGRLAERRLTGADFAMDMAAFAGMDIIPILYAVTPWFNFADYPLPVWVQWAGVTLLIFAIWLLWLAQADLAQNWTPTLHIHEGHQLVTHGVYTHIRHPIYAAIWLTGLAQALMLGNWLAGPACLVLFLPVFLVRVPREEQLMLDQFGEEYRAYMDCTGGIIPRFRS